jgi:hypothetical protein
MAGVVIALAAVAGVVTLLAAETVADVARRLHTPTIVAARAPLQHAAAGREAVVRTQQRAVERPMVLPMQQHVVAALMAEAVERMAVAANDASW